MGKLVVVPVREYTQYLYDTTNNFAIQYQQQGIDYPTANRIVLQIVNDVLNKQLIWSKASEGLGDVLAEIFPFWENRYDERQTPLMATFQMQVIGPLYSMINGFIYDTLPHQTWDVWYTNRMGLDVVLEQGEDYRIISWHRHIESGDWVD